MSFLEKKISLKFLFYKIKNVLQTCPLKNDSLYNHPNVCFLRRASVSDLLTYIGSVIKAVINRLKRKTAYSASLTLEAACAMPVFLFAILNLICFLEIYQIQMNLQAALHQCAKEMAVYGYAYDRVQKEPSFLDGTIAQVAFSEMYVRRQVNKYVTKSVLDASCIEGGNRGITYSLSKIMENDRIELVALYRIKPRFQMIPFPKTFTVTKAVVRAFTGYENTKENNLSDESETFVFVTESGEVYHKSRSCSHLKLSIQLAKKKELSMLRNIEGDRYKVCQRCKRSLQAEEIVVVTNLGDRYHTNIRCSGIKRTIEVISEEEALKRYRPCMRCVR